VNPLESYRRAQDGFDAVLASVPAKSWDGPSMCAQWSIRDVAGHVIWGQEQMLRWATGEHYPNRAGAPGAQNPGEMAGTDPVATWREARERSVAALTDAALDRMLELPGKGTVPVRAMVITFTTDHLGHTWDIGNALGIDVALDADLVTESFEWARANVIRIPGFFGPELTTSPGADEQTRWLAFLGRAATAPLPA
jgi:uncharacterized protein (TIGR03086 family)